MFLTAHGKPQWLIPQIPILCLLWLWMLILLQSLQQAYTHLVGAVAGSLYVELTTMRQKEGELEYGVGFWNLQAHPQCHTSSNKATPCNSSQTFPQLGTKHSDIRTYGIHSHWSHDTTVFFHIIVTGLHLLSSTTKIIWRASFISKTVRRTLWVQPNSMVSRDW